MNNKILKIFLNQRAEQIAPRADIDLWPAIRERLSASNPVLPDLNGGPEMKWTARSFTILAPIALAILVPLAVIFALPQGRALADRFLSLFFVTAPDVRPFDPQELTPDLTPAITPAAGVAELESLSGWQVLQPAWLPDGYDLVNSDVRPESGRVVQEYIYQHAIGMQASYFYLGQRKEPFTDAWPVGVSAQIETVQIGDGKGEYVIGAWGGAEDHLEWEPNPAFQTLRWQANGFYFEISYSIWGFEQDEMADCPYYLSKEQLVKIAASLK